MLHVVQNKVKALSSILLALLPLTSVWAIGLPTHRNIKVTDSESEPVADAEVVVGWSWGGSWTEGPKGNSKKGKTNKNGKYTFLWLTKGRLGVTAEKEGYYRTHTIPQVGEDIVVQLREKKNPIPMYAKRAKIDLPNGDGDFGYDMTVGDLVKPHGVGEHTDFIFRVSTTEHENEYREWYKLHGEIVFSNENDGIQAVYVPYRVYPRSEYRLPFTAPKDGYLVSLTQAIGSSRENYIRDKEDNVWFWTEDFFWKDPAQNWAEEAHFFMKVRSDEESGACYAILRNPPKFSYRAGDMPWITFDYFFNPAHSRNLEFDKDKNMMKEFRRYRLEEYKPGYP